MNDVISITKPAYNDEMRTMQFRRPDGQGQLGPTEVVSTCEVLCTNFYTGEDVTSSMISDVSPYSDTQVKYRLKGGTKGDRYLLQFRVVSSNSQKLEDSLLLLII